MRNRGKNIDTETIAKLLHHYNTGKKIRSRGRDDPDYKHICFAILKYYFCITLKIIIIYRLILVEWKEYILIHLYLLISFFRFIV